MTTLQQLSMPLSSAAERIGEIETFAEMARNMEAFSIASGIATDLGDHCADFLAQVPRMLADARRGYGS